MCDVCLPSVFEVSNSSLASSVRAAAAGIMALFFATTAMPAAGCSCTVPGRPTCVGLQQLQPLLRLLQGEFRRAAIACVSRRLQASLASAASQAAGDTNQLLETQTELTQRGAHLQMAVSVWGSNTNILISTISILVSPGGGLDLCVQITGLLAR